MEEDKEKLKISESYIVSVDIGGCNGNDTPMVMVSSYNGRDLVFINTIIGDDAVQLYQKLKGE